MIHSWKLDEMDALLIQQHLTSKTIKRDQLNVIKDVACVDVAYDKKSDKLFAAAVVLDADSFDIAEIVFAKGIVQFPYIPDLFSFKEISPIVKALK